MKKHLLFSVAALLVASPVAVIAAEMEGHEHHAENHKDHKKFEDMTLEDARARAKERSEKLDKMTPEEWDAHKKERMEKHKERAEKRKERREEWEKMSPEEREAKKKELREKRDAKKEAPAAQ